MGMDTVPTYSQLLIFYALLGTVNGTALAIAEGHDRYRLAMYQTIPALLGLVAFVYVVLGIGEMRGGVPIYAYLPILLLWWAGSRFGKTIVPGDWGAAGFPCTFFGIAVAIYHYGL